MCAWEGFFWAPGGGGVGGKKNLLLMISTVYPGVAKMQAGRLVDHIDNKLDLVKGIWSIFWIVRFSTWLRGS